MFEELWNHRVANTQTQVQAYKTELVAMERKVEQFLDRIGESDVPSVWPRCLR